MIDINSVAYTYKKGKEICFPDFTIPKGGQCLLLGESGSGKTTLLHLTGGLLQSQRGHIIINNTDITTLSASALDHFRGAHAGFIFQKNHLIDALSVKQNLFMAPFLAGLKRDEQRLDEVLAQLGLIDKKESRIKDLSQGQAQRVAFARAILNKPSVIFADEPTSALDDKNCDKVIGLLLDVATKNQSTLLIATHDQRLKSKIQMQVNLLSEN